MATLVKSAKTLNDLANNRKNKYAVIAVDETEYWTEDIRNKAGKIECVYLVNLRMPTHCCELSVSYPAVAISNFFHNVDAWRDAEGNVSVDLLELEKCEGIDDNVEYFSGNSIFDIKRMYTSGTFEDAIENEFANPAYC